MRTKRVRRLLFFLLTLWVAASFNFFIPRLMPGDPIAARIAQSEGRLSIVAAEELRRQAGLDNERTLFKKYCDYLGRIFMFDFGLSISDYPTPVSVRLFQAIPWSVVLVGVAVILSFIIGSWLGFLSAWYRHRRIMFFVVSFSTFMRAFPYFWLALVSQYVLATVLGWFPSSHGYDPFPVKPLMGWDWLWSVISHAILPAFTLIIGTIGSWVVLMRNATITVISEDYIRAARACGLKGRTIRWAYGARNSILPSVTDFAMTFGFIISGTILTEVVFSYPGVGKLLLDSIYTLDYPLMQAIFFLIALCVLLSNLVTDLLYTRLDPRIRERS